jgi:hypothetical protein
MLPTSSLVPLGLFTLVFLAASLHGLAALGHFPRASRNDRIGHGLGPALLWLSILVVLLCAVVGVIAAWQLVPWYAAVIAGGLAILVAPLLLQYFSDGFVDGYGALAVFTVVALIPAALLVWAMTA